MRELRGIVYMLKRIGPRTDPCGTSQVAKWKGNEVEPKARIQKVRNDR